MYWSNELLDNHFISTLEKGSIGYLAVYALKIWTSSKCLIQVLIVISTKNVSVAAIAICRRCLRSSSLLAFYKIGVLKILRKAHMSESLFNKVVDLLDWNFKLKTASRTFLIFFNEFCKFYRTPPDGCFWYLENLTFKHLILNKFVHLINICPHAIFDE